MIIEPVAAPSGDAIIDTKNIQRVIDKLYNDKKQGIIQLKSGTYKIGYFRYRNAEGGYEEVQTDDYRHNHTHDYKFIGLSLKMLAPSDIPGTNSKDTFFEIRGSNTGQSVLEKFELPPMVQIDPEILDYLNNYYRAITKPKSAGEIFKAEDLPMLRVLELKKVNTSHAIGDLLRRIIRHKLGRDEADSTIFIERLLNGVEGLKKWDKTRLRFKSARLISTYDHYSADYRTYSNDADSLYAKLNNLVVDGINHIEQEKGWYSNQYQFEQSHLLMVYARDGSDTLGKVSVNCQNSVFKNSISDGILGYANSKIGLKNMTAESCSRSSFGTTATNSEFHASNVVCYGTDIKKAVLGFEIDHPGANPTMRVRLYNITADHIKLSMGLAEADIRSVNLNARNGFNYQGYKCNTRISNSNFTVAPLESNGGASFQILYPGTARFYNCKFAFKEKNKITSDRSDVLSNLLTVTMQHKDLYRKEDGDVYMRIKVKNERTNETEYIEDRGELLEEALRINQSLLFDNCSFVNDSKLTIDQGAYLGRDYLENGNQTKFEQCRFSGGFQKVLHQHNGRLILEDFTADLRAIDSENDALLTRFMHFRDDNNAAWPFGLEFEVTGTLNLTNIHYYHYFSTCSRRTRVYNDNVAISMSQSRLYYTGVRGPIPIEIEGKRKIKGVHSGPQNPNSLELDGLIGDEFIPASSAIPLFRCVQSGDFQLDRPAKWKLIVIDTKPPLNLNWSKMKKFPNKK